NHQPVRPRRLALRIRQRIFGRRVRTHPRIRHPLHGGGCMTEVTPQTRAARHLTQIVHMYADLSTEAVNRASSKDMPGGDAMVLLAPGADLAAYKYRQMSAIMGRIDVPIDDTEGDPDP